MTYIDNSENLLLLDPSVSEPADDDSEVLLNGVRMSLSSINTAPCAVTYDDVLKVPCSFEPPIIGDADKDLINVECESS